MSSKVIALFSSCIVAFLMIGMVMLNVQAAGDGVSASTEWTTDTFADFSYGSMDGVDIWDTDGEVKLLKKWFPNVRVNDSALEGRNNPRLTYIVTGTGQTDFLITWDDERVQDHNPDIYFAHSTDGGATWSTDKLVSGSHVNGLSKNKPDIAVRSVDESYWVVWQDTRLDDGDVYYAKSTDGGNSWSSASKLFGVPGAQIRPRIVSHDQSGYLYTIWEDEKIDDGDIYIARYNPDVDSSWGAPIKVSNDTTASEQRDVNLAADGDGNIFAVWLDEREQDEYQGDIYFSRWISGSTWVDGSWSTDSLLSDSTMDYALSPDIVADSNGELFATWMERVPTGPATYDFQIVLGHSQDSGDTWSRSVVHRLVDASASNAFYGNPAVDVNNQGQVYVAWLHNPDSQAATSNVLFSISPDNGEHWTVPDVLNYPLNKVSGDSVPALITTNDGESVVAWDDFRDASATMIYAAGYPANKYLFNGTYRSPILDTFGVSAWGNITWTATITPSSNITLSTRVMTSTGMGWSEWIDHTSSGEELSHDDSRYFQYKATFTSDGSTTSSLDKVIISYDLLGYLTFLPNVHR